MFGDECFLGHTIPYHTSDPVGHGATLKEQSAGNMMAMVLVMADHFVLAATLRPVGATPAQRNSADALAEPPRLRPVSGTPPTQSYHTKVNVHRFMVSCLDSQKGALHRRC